MSSPFPSGNQPSPALTSRRANNTGNIMATAGGAVAVISFVALPYLSLGLLGSFTGVQTEMLSASYTLWLQLVLAILVTVLAGLSWLWSQMTGRPTARRLALGTLVAAVLGVLAMFLTLSVRSGGATQVLIPYLGFGYWLMTAGLVVAVIGAIVQMRR